MRYTLITKTGRVYTFYLKAVAETYQQAYGGTLVDNSVVEKPQTVPSTPRPAYYEADGGSMCNGLGRSYF